MAFTKRDPVMWRPSLSFGETSQAELRWDIVWIDAYGAAVA